MTWRPAHYVADDSWTVAYRRTGSGPPLLLLHATLSSSAQLRPLADRLARRFTIVAVDRRGSGASQPPAGALPTAIDVAVHLDDLAAILDREQLGPVLAVGHSYGGCLALELAARRPKLVAAAWAFEPPYAPVGPSAIRAALAEVGRRTMAAGERGGAARAAEVFLAAVAGQPALGALSPPQVARLRSSGHSALADASLLGLDGSGLARIRCPVGLAGGNASPPFYDQLLSALAATIGTARVERIDGVGHAAPISHPLAVAAAVEEFADLVGWAGRSPRTRADG